MKRIKFLIRLGLSAVAVLALIGPSVAQGNRGGHHHKPKPTHITINKWIVGSAAQPAHSVSPGSTYRHCATDTVTSLQISGRYQRIVAGKHIVKKWLVNGQARDVFHAHWIKTSRAGPYSTGISNSSGLPDGKWKFQMTQGGKTIGQSSFTLATNSSC